MLQNKFLDKEYTTHHTEFFNDTIDGQKLFVQCWDAGSDSKAAILLVHGMGEHSSRYDKWARQFNQAGFSICSFDLRGHGRTPGKRGGFYHFDKMLEDINLMLEHVSKTWSGKPVFIYGHSFGGNLVANFAISRQLNVHGVILTSPWFEVGFPLPQWKVLVAKVLYKFAPQIISTNEIRIEELSRELREIHLYKNDPLIHNQISIGLFMNAVHQGLLAKRSIYKINVPLLVIHGTADKITSFKASKEFVANSGEKTTFIEIEGGYHELHNDSDRNRVFKFITDWADKQLKD